MIAAFLALGMHVALFLSFWLNPRSALFFLGALYIAAAVPLAIAWAWVIPPDDPEEARPYRKEALVLLILVTLSFAAKLPGGPDDWVQSRFLSHASASWVHWTYFVAVVFLVLFPILAVVYALRWPNSLDRHLFWAGFLVVCIWFLAPALVSSFLRTSSW